LDWLRCSRCFKFNSTNSNSKKEKGETMKFTITSADIKRNKVLEPNWYTVKITKIEEKPAKDQESINKWVHFEVLSHDESINGVPLRRCFNEKAPGFVIPFIKIMAGKNDIEPGEYEITERLVDRQLRVHVTQQEQFVNSVDDFLPL
jgi:hypothetical protein